MDIHEGKGQGFQSTIQGVPFDSFIKTELINRKDWIAINN